MPAKRWHWTLRKKTGQNRGPGFWRLWQKLCLAPRISPAKAGLGKSGKKRFLALSATCHLVTEGISQLKPVCQIGIHFKGNHCRMPSAPRHDQYIKPIWSRSLYTPRQCYLSDESSDGQCVSGGCVTFCDGGGGQLGAAGSWTLQTAWSHRWYKRTCSDAACTSAPTEKIAWCALILSCMMPWILNTSSNRSQSRVN